MSLSPLRRKPRAAAAPSPLPHDRDPSGTRKGMRVCARAPRTAIGRRCRKNFRTRPSTCRDTTWHAATAVGTRTRENFREHTRHTTVVRPPSRRRSRKFRDEARTPPLSPRVPDIEFFPFSSGLGAAKMRGVCARRPSVTSRPRAVTETDHRRVALARRDRYPRPKPTVFFFFASRRGPLSSPSARPVAATVVTVDMVCRKCWHRRQRGDTVVVRQFGPRSLVLRVSDGASLWPHLDLWVAYDAPMRRRWHISLGRCGAILELDPLALSRTTRTTHTHTRARADINNQEIV